MGSLSPLFLNEELNKDTAVLLIFLSQTSTSFLSFDSSSPFFCAEHTSFSDSITSSSGSFSSFWWDQSSTMILLRQKTVLSSLVVWWRLLAGLSHSSLSPLFFFFLNVIRDGEEANEVPHSRTHNGMYRWNAVFKNTKGNQKKKGKARTRNLNKVVFCVFPM